MADIAAAARFDFAWESEAVSIVLADQWASLDGKRRRAALSVYIDYAKSSRVYFDAVRRIREKSHSQGEPIPRSAHQAAGGGCPWEPAASRQQAPPAPIAPSNRPSSCARSRFGSLSRSCGALGYHRWALSSPAVASWRRRWIVPEDTVTRIWKRPFELMMRQHMKATAERNGPFHTHGVLSEAQATVSPIPSSRRGHSPQLSVTGALPLVMNRWRQRTPCGDGCPVRWDILMLRLPKLP